MNEVPPYSREELRRRLEWSKNHSDPSVFLIARTVGMDKDNLYGFMKGDVIADHWVRILTDFYHKWDLGMYEAKQPFLFSKAVHLVRSENPIPRKKAAVDWQTGKLTFKPLPELMGTAKTWLPNALDRLEMLGSCENILASPTGRSKRTKKGARKAVTR